MKCDVLFVFNVFRRLVSYSQSLSYHISSSRNIFSISEESFNSGSFPAYGGRPVGVNVEGRE